MLALFLNPKYKSLIPIIEAKRQGMQRLAKDLLCTQPCDSMESVICISEDSTGASIRGVSVGHSYSHDHFEGTRLIASNLDNEFLEWKYSATDNQHLDEVDQYVQASFDFEALVLSNSIEFDIVAFWQCIAITKQYPKLSRLELGMLSVPASSATNERTFSSCGNVLETKRGS